MLQYEGFPGGEGGEVVTGFFSSAVRRFSDFFVSSVMQYEVFSTFLLLVTVMQYGGFPFFADRAD